MSRVRRVVVGALVAVSVSACSGGGSGGASTSASLPEPSITMYPSEPNSPTTTPSGSASMSATPTGTSTTTASASAAATASIPEPVLPAEAKAHTPDGAAAFARHYMDVVNYAYMKPDPAAIRDLSLPSCTTCEGFASYAETLKQTRYRADKPMFIVSSSDPGPLVGSTQPVIVSGRDAGYRLIGPAGEDASPLPDGAQAVLEVDVAFNGKWQVTAIAKSGS